MPYKLYYDRNENFECEVSVKNASLRDSFARLVVESNEGTNLVFNGKIENGKCVVPIRRLKGLLDENSHGKVFLEVVVEDTYFRPWQSDFIVEEHTSVKVMVNENRAPRKPSVNVKVAEKPVVAAPKKENAALLPLHELTQLCKKFGITRKTLPVQKNELKQILSEYFRYNPEFKKNKGDIIGKLKHFLA